ncbi:hypothetical protein GYMLUDRAFT_239534 [Collybiopsis luxurians FD-317 M1]|nr:hypothetical protein GYMLUDRAFT_239534 [Collybiopsis luxurians FD-317 M1]
MVLKRQSIWWRIMRAVKGLGDRKTSLGGITLILGMDAGYLVDPNRTMTAGKVDVRAFRTYLENYSPPKPIQVEIFTSNLETQLWDLLENEYWTNTLSQSPLFLCNVYAVSQVTDLNSNLSKDQHVYGTPNVSIDSYVPQQGSTVILNLLPPPPFSLHLTMDALRISFSAFFPPTFDLAQGRESRLISPVLSPPSSLSFSQFQIDILLR